MKVVICHLPPEMQQTEESYESRDLGISDPGSLMPTRPNAHRDCLAERLLLLSHNLRDNDLGVVRRAVARITVLVRGASRADIADASATIEVCGYRLKRLADQRRVSAFRREIVAAMKVIEKAIEGDGS